MSSRRRKQFLKREGKDGYVEKQQEKRERGKKHQRQKKREEQQRKDQAMPWLFIVGFITILIVLACIGYKQKG